MVEFVRQRLDVTLWMTTFIGLERRAEESTARKTGLADCQPRRRLVQRTRAAMGRMHSKGAPLPPCHHRQTALSAVAVAPSG